MAHTMRLTLPDGPWIELEILYQCHIYSGLLVGYPTASLNQEIIRHELEKKRKETGTEPYLVPPRETLRTFPPPTSRSLGEPVSLPEILCIGHWRSLTPARRPDHDSSWLVVLWFQDEFAFPIDPQVLEHLTGIDWNRLAVDGEY